MAVSAPDFGCLPSSFVGAGSYSMSCVYICYSIFALLLLYGHYKGGIFSLLWEFICT